MRRRRDWSTLILLGPPLAFLLVLFAVPLARVVWGSFFAPDLTLEHYRRMWTVPVYGRVFWITLKVSALTTLFCILLGYPAAYFLASVSVRTRQALVLAQVHIHTCLYISTFVFIDFCYLLVDKFFCTKSLISLYI